MATDAAVTIREFGPGDAAAFRRLNEEWITRYFELEPADEEILTDPQSTILDSGGRIFLAVRNGEAVGCCALKSTDPGEFEVVKMAVTESCQRGGIGRRLLETAVAEARAAGAARLHLETNRKLAAAVRMYESLGFQHVPASCLPPSAYVRCDVSMELRFDGAT